MTTIEPAVHRALVAVAGELAMADREADRARRTGFGHRFAGEFHQRARVLTYFAVATVAQQDLCTLNERLARVPQEQQVGEPLEAAYMAALLDYCGLEDA